MGRVLELYGIPSCKPSANWPEVVHRQHCPYIGRKCLKVRKSTPERTIGTCSVEYGRSGKRVVICPHRLLEKQRVFMDCLHLLTLHEPGNDLHVIAEVSVPGGSVDYFLVSARDGKVKDFLGIELQAVDTTGTVWPERQRFLHRQGLETGPIPSKTFGLNWKMTAKTVLLQLHHKLETFEHIHKHLVLVVQDHFLAYMRDGFRLDRLNSPARIGDSMHIHSYTLKSQADCGWQLSLDTRMSTDADGIARSLGLRSNPRVALERLTAVLEEKLSDSNLLTWSQPVRAPSRT